MVLITKRLLCEDLKRQYMVGTWISYYSGILSSRHYRYQHLAHALNLEDGASAFLNLFQQKILVYSTEGIRQLCKEI